MSWAIFRAIYKKLVSWHSRSVSRHAHPPPNKTAGWRNSCADSRMSYFDFSKHLFWWNNYSDRTKIKSLAKSGHKIHPQSNAFVALLRYGRVPWREMKMHSFLNPPPGIYWDCLTHFTFAPSLSSSSASIIISLIYHSNAFNALIWLCNKRHIMEINQFTQRTKRQSKKGRVDGAYLCP